MCIHLTLVQLITLLFLLFLFICSVVVRYMDDKHKCTNVNMYSISNPLNSYQIVDDCHELDASIPNTCSKTWNTSEKNQPIHNSLKKLFISSKPKNRDTLDNRIVDDEFLNYLMDTELLIPNPKRRKINSSDTSILNPSSSSILTGTPSIESFTEGNQSGKYMIMS